VANLSDTNITEGNLYETWFALNERRDAHIAPLRTEADVEAVLAMGKEQAAISAELNRRRAPETRIVAAKAMTPTPLPPDTRPKPRKRPKASFKPLTPFR
jgi:hypothetical protein